MVSQGPDSALPSPIPIFPERLRLRPDHPNCFCGVERKLSAGHLKTFFDLATYGAILAHLSSIKNRTFVLSVRVVQSSHPSTHAMPHLGSPTPPRAAPP